MLGGPLQVNVNQESGGVFVILPSKRELDPYVFGSPKLPRAYGGTPGINGLPPEARAVSNGEYTQMKKPSPFGNKNIVMGNGKLMIEALDATAADAPKSNDKVKFSASWQDEEGNTYKVRCCEMLATQGIEYPTFGGVVTNHILHGSSRIGSALMPTEYVYMAFWGMGAVWKMEKWCKNHGLCTVCLPSMYETEGYELAMDDEVTPGRKHFHLMVPPMKPQMEEGNFVH